MIGATHSKGAMPTGNQQSSARGDLWNAAQMLESTFLAEMLKSAGLGEARREFGGGIGEDHFAGLLATEQARIMTEAGGIGLAEAIYRSLSLRVEGKE